MENNTKEEILAKLKKAKEGEFPSFQQAIQRQINLLEGRHESGWTPSSMSSSSSSSSSAVGTSAAAVVTVAGAAGKKNVRQRQKDKYCSLRMLAMVAKAEALEECPEHATPSASDGDVEKRHRTSKPGYLAKPEDAVIDVEREAAAVDKHKMAMKAELEKMPPLFKK